MYVYIWLLQLKMFTLNFPSVNTEELGYCIDQVEILLSQLKIPTPNGEEY